MKQKFFLLLALILAIAQGWAATNSDGLTTTQRELFSALVGKTDSKVITVNFETDGNNPDPNQPVIMSNGVSQQSIVNNFYSISIDGTDSDVFTAVITNASLNSCSVCVTYSPSSVGSHFATLKVQNLVGINVSPVYIQLIGEASQSSNGHLPTHSSGIDLSGQINGVELSNEIRDEIIFKPNDFEYYDIPLFRNPALASAIVSFVESFAPTIHIDELYENETFNDVTAGTSATKTYMVWGHNIYNLAEEARSLNSQPGFKDGLPPGAKIALKIKLRLNGCIIDITPATYAPVADDIFYSNPKMFTVNPSLFRPFDIDLDEGGERMPLTVTFNPTTAGLYQFRFQAMIEFYVNGIYMPEWLTYIPILYLGEQELHTGTAVERTITPSRRNLDFGEILMGKEKSDTITVTGFNLKGDLTLETDNPNYTVTPSSISANDAANGVPVTVTYKPTAEGNHDAKLTIKGGKAVDVPINLTGSCVVPKVTFTPNVTHLNFGPIVNGQTDKESFTLTGTNLSSNLTLTTNSFFTVNPNKITPEEAVDGVKVTVSYNPTEVGTHSTKLYICGGGVENGPIEVNLSGQCVANQSINVSPSTHNFGTVKENEEKSMTFTVTGNNLSDRIVLTWSQEDGFTITPRDLPASGGKVTVTFKPTNGGDYSQQYTLSSGNTSAIITVSGKCAAATTSKSDLCFGTVAKGETKTQNFTVTGLNLTHDLTLTSSNSSIFIVSPDTITAAQAKAGKKVTVTFKPGALIDYSEAITISGQDIKSKTVSLSGKCANITVSPATYNFGTCTKNKTYTKQFTVTGTNVGERITIVDQYEEGFTVSPTDLPASGGTVTVTFKPTSAGSSYSYEFTASGGGTSSSKVSVTGKCGTPTITVNPTSLRFTPASHSKTITVTGLYLTGNLTLSCSNAPFAVTPKTITPSQAENGVTVTVECNRPGNSDCTGTITISGGGAKSINVSLSYVHDGSEPAEINSILPADGSEENKQEFTYGGSGNSTTGVHELMQEAKIFAEGKNIIIESPVEQSAIISDVAGRARRVNLQAGRNEVPVNASGIYIVGIREKTAKLMIK